MSKNAIKPAVRYSEAFKIQVVRELETGLINIDQIRRKYGIGGCGSIRNWIGKYGNGTVGKIIRVEKREEVNERAALKKRVQQLEALVADAQVDLAIERATSKLLAKRAGVVDLEEFKKKVRGA
jgi:transposase-like protein